MVAPVLCQSVTKATGLDVGQEQEAEAVLEEALRQLQEPAPGELTVKTRGKRWNEDRKFRGKLEWTHQQSHLEFFVYGPLGHLALPQVTDARGGSPGLEWCLATSPVAQLVPLLDLPGS